MRIALIEVLLTASGEPVVPAGAGMRPDDELPGFGSPPLAATAVPPVLSAHAAVTANTHTRNFHINASCI